MLRTTFFLLLLSVLQGTAAAEPWVYPKKLFQAEGEIVQMEGNRSGSERYRGFFVLDGSGAIHQVPGHGMPPVRLDDGRPARKIWHTYGALYRFISGELEVLGDLPGQWSSVELEGYEGREVESLWPDGGWVQLSDGEVLKLRHKKSPISVGRLPALVSSTRRVLIDETGGVTTVDTRGVLLHQMRIEPAPRWGYMPEVYKKNTLTYVTAEGRLSVIRQVPGLELKAYASSATPRIDGVLAIKEREHDVNGHVAVLREDGVLLDVHLFAGPERFPEVRKLAKIPGATGLELVEFNYDEDLWAVVSTGDGGVYGVSFDVFDHRDVLRRRTSFRELHAETL